MNTRLVVLIAVVLLVSSGVGRAESAKAIPGPCQYSLKACPPPAPLPCGAFKRMPCPQPKR
jgi:hypothetical protein